MIDKRTTSAIDSAFMKHETPCGPVYVARRHGRIKKCFSRNTAIRYLAFFMATHVFETHGFIQRHPDVQRIHPVNPELNRIERGGVTAEYYLAHLRTVRRLRRILASKRAMHDWCAKWDAMHDRYVKEVNELQATRPAAIICGVTNGSGNF